MRLRALLHKLFAVFAGRRDTWIALAVLGTATACGALLWANESLADRRQRIENMTEKERDGLRRRADRFAALDPAEQQRLRCLQQDLEHDPQAEHLRTVLHNYHKWLASLPDARRDELMAAEPAQRLKQIKLLLDAQPQPDLVRLSPRDAAGLARWLEEFARRHEAVLLESLPESKRPLASQRLAKLNEPERGRLLTHALWEHWRVVGVGGRSPLLSERDLVPLRGHLTADTRRRLETKPSSEQMALVTRWVGQLVHQQFKQGAAAGLFSVGDEELANFFEHVLTDEQRDQLLRLPADDMQRDLRKKFWATAKADWTGRGLHPSRPKRAGSADGEKPPKAKGKKILPSTPLPRPAGGAQEPD
jgi:hypothetical protein